ncbi:hypothetical protein [Paracoccus sp. (in: a-proteobacteria)]|uniref:hypothetical protein n=1 Tax=Paracoccus sp. TaxID=267 RepID=UPI00321FFEC1
MTRRHYTLSETLLAVEGLTEAQLERHILAGVVLPVQSEQGPLFRELDLARLGLMVDLAEGYQLEEDALALVLSLVDQLHGLRGDLRAILDAVAREPAETRLRLKAAIREMRLVSR